MDNGKLQLVLVDDNADDRLVFRLALAKSGLDVDLFEAADGSAALNYLLDKEPDSNRSDVRLPDLIFLDLKMPGMDGFAVLKEIRAKLGWQNVPVIVFSNSGSESDRTAAYALGASAFHNKPRCYEELLALLQSMVALWPNNHLVPTLPRMALAKIPSPESPLVARAALPGN
jgi:CheY-like chemotaxis protein